MNNEAHLTTLRIRYPQAVQADFDAARAIFSRRIAQHTSVHESAFSLPNGTQAATRLE
jgi:hypothetical protein